MAANDKDIDPGRGELTPEEREGLKKRASEIGKRLDEVKARRAPPVQDQRARGAAMGEAFKIVAELMVGVVLGGAAGWFLDRQFGTAPWLLVLFLMLGFGGGLSNVIRTARRMQAGVEAMQKAGKPASGNDDDDDDEHGAGGESPVGEGKPVKR